MSKTGHPSSCNDFRPVVPTSQVMKNFERLVLQRMRTLLIDFMNTLLFRTLALRMKNTFYSPPYCLSNM